LNWLQYPAGGGGEADGPPVGAGGAGGVLVVTCTEQTVSVIAEIMQGRRKHAKRARGYRGSHVQGRGRFTCFGVCL